MIRLSFVAIVLIFSTLALGGCESKTKQSTEKQEAGADRPDTTSKNNTTTDSGKPAADTVPAGKDTVHKTPGAITMTMLFENYEEGDYPHLLFRDVATGKEYDFRFTDDNNYSGIPLLLEDKIAAFGHKANPIYLKKLFVVEAAKQNVVDADLQGKSFKTKDWVITSLRQKP